MNRRHYAVMFLLTWPAAATGQSSAKVGGRAEIFVGSELERYLRFLQSDARAALYPWSIGAFSPSEIDRMQPRDSTHPWAGRYALDGKSPGPAFELIPPTVTTIENTTFPYGSNDGPIWAGRGLTGATQVGFAARYGPLSLTIAPMVFSAQNAGFPLQANGHSSDTVFADGLVPLAVDRPQRFGTNAYNALDPGQSTLRLDVSGVVIGASTANQRWGPGELYPILLGNNAAGFPHVFVGSSAPWDLWIVRVHGRIEWGELFQSDYSTVTGVQSKRFMSGIVAIVSPRGLPGLELGGARFFHTPWPAGGLRMRDFRKPIESIFKFALPNEVPGEHNQDLDNQLASVFFRWVLPRSGAELYGEYGRDDHNYDVRAFMLRPDNFAGYLLGLRKLWRRGTDRFVSLRAELVDVSMAAIYHGNPAPFYSHSFTRQGHTYRGQMLGADVADGGAASTLAVDYYHPAGRWSVSWSRVLRQDVGEYWRTGVLNPKSLDVVHTLALEGVFFRGPFDLTGRLAGSYEFNRNFQKDAFNLNAVLRVRAALGR